MSSSGNETAAERLRLALEMFEVGESMMLERLRRRFPSAADAELRARLASWLRTRPGAEHGDACGRPVGRRREPR